MSCSEFRWAVFFLICFRSCYLLPTHRDCNFPGPEVAGCANPKSKSLIENCELLKKISQVVCDTVGDADIPKFEDVKKENEDTICENLKTAAANVAILSASELTSDQHICNYFCTDSVLKSSICINILIGARKISEKATPKTDAAKSIGSTKTDSATPEKQPKEPKSTTEDKEKSTTKSKNDDKSATKDDGNGNLNKDKPEPKGITDKEDTKSDKHDSDAKTDEGDTKTEKKPTAEDANVGKDATGKENTNKIATASATNKDTPSKSAEKAAKTNKVAETTKSEAQTPTSSTSATTETASTTTPTAPKTTEEAKTTTTQKVAQKEPEDAEPKPDGGEEGAPPPPPLDQDSDADDGAQPDEGENNGNLIDAPEDGEQLQPPKKPVDAVDNQSLDGAMQGPELQQYADSHFFIYFLTAVVLCVLLYLVFHNKQKIIALIIEGRHERRRRASSVSYKKLDNNLDQVLHGGKGTAVTPSHIIY